MKDIVENFINAKNTLNQKFDCNEDFFIKPLIDKKWAIKDNEGIFFLKLFLIKRMSRTAKIQEKKQKNLLTVLKKQKNILVIWEIIKN